MDLDIKDIVKERQRCNMRKMDDAIWERCGTGWIRFPYVDPGKVRETFGGRDRSTDVLWRVARMLKTGEATWRRQGFTG